MYVEVLLIKLLLTIDWTDFNMYGNKIVGTYATT